MISYQIASGLPAASTIPYTIDVSWLRKHVEQTPMLSRNGFLYELAREIGEAVAHRGAVTLTNVPDDTLAQLVERYGTHLHSVRERRAFDHRPLTQVAELAALR